MDADRKGYYRALAARDRRFDGLFYVGVTTTGIYCRPICTAKTPRATSCRFFHTPQEAELARFRPCLRCRPELAPGSAPVDDAQRIARLIVQRLEDGRIGNDAGLEAIAGQFGLSSRQIRRIVRQELGVAPIQLLQTRRLLLAKQLLTETRLPVTQIAYASGFSSLRRFNDAFQSRYRLAPSRLRKAASDDTLPPAAHTSTLQLCFRPPYDWEHMLAFFAARALPGVELVTPDSYARTVRSGTHTGCIRITRSPQPQALLLEFTHSLLPVLPWLIRRVRDLFDLDARPDVIAAHFSRDTIIGPLIKSRPGLRVPGAFDPFELALRAVLGQQVSVRSGTLAAGRIATAFGERIVTPFAGLERLAPTAARLGRAGLSDIAGLGIVRSRAATLIALAQAHAAGCPLPDGDAHVDPVNTLARLTTLPGIGPWTAQYIALRAGRWPDAFPRGDVAVRNALGGVSAAQAEQLSQPWRPWRAYAVLHLWNSLTTKDSAHEQAARKPRPRSHRHPGRRRAAGH